MFVREYFALADNLTDCKLRFMNDLRLLFPGFTDVFKKPFSAAALTVLKFHPSLVSFQTADLEKLAGVVAKAARRSPAWAKKKLLKLFDCAQIAGLSGFLRWYSKRNFVFRFRPLRPLVQVWRRLKPPSAGRSRPMHFLRCFGRTSSYWMPCRASALSRPLL